MMSYLRPSLGALALGLLLGLPGGDAIASAPTPAAESTTTNKAHVKLEIKQEDGKVLRNKGDLLDWGQSGTVVIEADEHKHAVELQLTKGSDSTLTVTLAYERDGTPVVAPYTFDTKIKKREVIHIEGGAAIALTITPKAVKQGDAAPPPEESPEPAPKDKDKIEIGTNPNDPLGGLE
jgi:hypothetical protein